MAKVTLSKLEAEALWFAADNMRDDFYDYHSFMPKMKRDKYHEAFLSGLNKLHNILKKKDSER